MNYFTMPAIKTQIVDNIIETVCRKYNTTYEDLVGPCRKQDLVFPRHLTMYAIRDKTNTGPTELGRMFNRSHASIIHAFEAIENYIDTNSGKKEEIIQLIYSV